MHQIIKKLRKLHMLVLIVGILVTIVFVGAHRSYAAQKKYPYQIKINRYYNTVTVYAKDSKGKYTKPIRAMLCSVGRDGKTIKGTYRTKAKYRWKILMNDVWGQYSTRIDGGMLFHSVYYYDNNPADLATREFNKLGSSVSHGCVRLMVRDAKWIYDNCSVGTTVVVYDDKKSPGPLGKPTPIKIASNVRWDPTDPDRKNPYLKKTPVITGVKNMLIKWNQGLDLLKNVKAESSVGVNITKKIKVLGNVDVSTPGSYRVKYSVIDDLQKSISKTITVTVDKNKVAPTFKGITDAVVGTNVNIDKTFALKNVTAYCSGLKLDKKLINVKITKENNNLYYIEYSASAGKGPIAKKIAKINIDKTPPVIVGAVDAVLKPGEVPTIVSLQKRITVTDNYTPSDKIKLKVTFVDNKDGTYIVTYEATDSVGNKSTVKCKLTVPTPTPSPTPTPTPTSSPTLTP